MRPKQLLIAIATGYVVFLSIKVYITPSNKNVPVLLWWTAFTPNDRTISCPGKYECLSTNDRKHLSNNNLKAILFYGTNLDIDDIPQCRPGVIWALFHEESPKNLPSLTELRVQRLFQLTSTFSRHSTLPLPLQYLKELSLLTTQKYYVNVKRKNDLLLELAPVAFIQSDCSTAIGREDYVEELMKYIKVDSYGACLNNKQIDRKFVLNGTYDLYNEEFMHFLGSYKFIIAIENARCHDYITEKLWRPLIVGSVPIYFGSPTVKDWLPNSKSAILLDNFSSMEKLADYINEVNSNDKLYLSYLQHKTEGIVSNNLLKEKLTEGYYGIPGNNEEYIVPSFECFVCQKMHTGEQIETPKESIYDCEEPKSRFWKEHWAWSREKSKKLTACRTEV